MKNALVSVFCMALVVGMFSCSKTGYSNNSCTGPTAAQDSSLLLAFAQKYGITPVRDTSYLYYQIINPGTGTAPTAHSKVYVRYAARLMDGTYFDSSAVSLRFALDSLIRGWQYGIPKIKPGGQIKLLVPSAQGYGCQGAGNVIPANAPLYFNIYLDSII